MITRIYTLKDSCGNSSQVTQRILVWDTLAPVITTCVPDTTVECATSIPAPQPNRLVGNDNCGGAVSGVFSRDSVYNRLCGNTFKIKRWYYLIDQCGNKDSCFQTISVIDTTRPVITCPRQSLCMKVQPVPSIRLQQRIPARRPRQTIAIR